MDKFITDNTGKSKSFFLKKNRKIKKTDISFLKKQGLKIKKSLRICLHSNKNSKLHSMINFLYKQKNTKRFIHSRTDEIYHLIEGELKIFIYDKKLNVLEKIFLKKNYEIYRLPKKTIHSTEPVKEFCIFSEHRLGPFNKKDNKEYSLKKNK